MNYFSELKPREAVTVDTRALSEDGLVVLERFGAGALGWCFEVADKLIETIFIAMPLFRSETADSPIFLRGVRSSVLRSLRMVAGDVELEPITDEGADVARDFARRDINVVYLMKSHRIGVPVIAGAFIEEAMRALPAEEATGEVKRISQLFFDWLEKFSDQMFGTYEREREHWLVSRTAEQLAVINAILEDRPIDTMTARQTLGYDVTARHVGVIAWSEQPQASQTDMLGTAVRDELQALGCRQVLVLPVGLSEAWGWGIVDSVATTRELQPPFGVFTASGQAHTGLRGFRQTYREAQSTQHLCRHATGHLPRGVRHKDVALAALMCADVNNARLFVRSQLGELATVHERYDTIRETLWLYLMHERSISTVAEKQFLARTTVTYRIKQAETLVGKRLLGETRLNIQAALLLTRLIPKHVLSLEQGTDTTPQISAPD